MGNRIRDTRTLRLPADIATALLALPAEERWARLRCVVSSPAAAVPPLEKALGELVSEVRQAVRLAEYGAGGGYFDRATASDRREGLRAAFAVITQAESLLAAEIRHQGGTNG